MAVRHVACAGVWARAGQRNFVPRTYPAPLNPLSPPSSGPQRGEPAVLAAAGVERRDPLTALQTGSKSFGTIDLGCAN
jgi:hypothetical protein